MYRIVVKRIQNYYGYDIPVVEGIFKEGQRVISIKTVCKLYDLEEFMVEELMRYHIEEFTNINSIVNISNILKKDKNIREKLGIKTYEIKNKNSRVFMLSYLGYLKLVELLDKYVTLDKNIDKSILGYLTKAPCNRLPGETTHNGNEYVEVEERVASDSIGKKGRRKIEMRRVDELIDYEELNIAKAEERYLKESEFKEILTCLNKNIYYKEIERGLKVPNTKKGIEFRKNEIKQFKDKVYEDVKLYILGCFEVEKGTDILRRDIGSVRMLVENYYSLSQELCKEYKQLINIIVDIRLEIVEYNQCKIQMAIEEKMI